MSSVLLVRAPGVKGAAESVVFRGTSLATGYTDRGLRPGRNYVYRLTAADAAANQTTKTLDFLARERSSSRDPVNASASRRSSSGRLSAARATTT